MLSAIDVAEGERPIESIHVLGHRLGMEVARGGRELGVAEEPSDPARVSPAGEERAGPVT